MADKGQQIYVEADYENIFVIDPNKVVDKSGKVQERYVDHEDLVMYANLEAKVLPRTKLANGTTIDQTVQNIRVGSLNGDSRENLNFLKPKGKNYFDDSWSDQITGKGSIEGRGSNQSVIETVGEGITQRKVKRIINNEDTQLLGITKIDFSITRAAVPTVKLTLVDVQGRALFEQGENSPYSAFMQYPYPPFLLTLKGFYGKAVQYELACLYFNASFDPSSGNYNVTVELQSYRFPLQKDILLDYLRSVPKISPSEIERRTGVDDPSNQGGVGITESTTSKSTLGYQKLNEVYLNYKSKGLIDDDFPHLTVTELKYKLDRFERSIMETYGQEDFSILSNIENYINSFNEYREKIYPSKKDNWYEKYIDPNEKYVINSISSPIYYKFKKELGIDGALRAIDELKQIVQEFNTVLNTNETLGSKGKYTISDKVKRSDIESNLKSSDLLKTLPDLTSVDFNKTYQVRKGTIGTPDEVQTLEALLRSDFAIDELTLNSQDEVESDPLVTTFIFFGESTNDIDVKNSYLNKIDNIQKQYTENKVKIEEDITNALSIKLQKKESNFGFVPSVNNIAAVLCASADAFLRIMDDVHEFAWNKRKEPTRLKSVISGEKSFGVDNKNVVGGTNDQVVYPWPQYIEKQVASDGQEKWMPIYPGQPSVLNKTQGFRFDLWPEIKFVEDYIRASIAREEQVIDYEFNNPQQVSKSVTFNTLSFPFEIQPYNDLEETSFFYEIFNRSLIPSIYSKLSEFNNTTNELYGILGDFEVVNIQQTSVESPTLLQKLKQYSFSSSNFEEYLRSISNNGMGLKWNQLKRDIISTEYLRAQTEKTSGLFSIDTISVDSLQVQGNSDIAEKLDTFLENTTSNKTSFLDTYPFTNFEKLKNLLSGGNSLADIEESRDTTKNYEFLPSKKTITSFSLEDDNRSKRPLTNFDWMINNMTAPNQSSDLDGSPDTEITNKNLLKEFFENRTLKDYLLTEGKIIYGENYSNKAVNDEQTTSILNTPYYINAILEGNQKSRDNISNPYVSLGYLILNGLPFSTLHDYLISPTEENNQTNESYFYATLSKLAAVHRVPYLWILKYGSIWHRYKKNVEGEDILDNIWNNTDVKSLYDPINSNPSKLYTVNTLSGPNKNVYLQKTFINPSTGENTVEINNGFYPKLINDMYYLFTKKDVVQNYDDQSLNEVIQNLNVKIDMNYDSSTIFNKEQNLVTENEKIVINNYYQYIDLNGNLDFEVNNNKLLLIPSCGYMNYNQTIFELTDNQGNLIEDIKNNESMLNGSIRSLWGGTNYGYFNNDLIAKPDANQYMKLNYQKSDSAFGFSSEKNDYDSIEEIFSIFDKQELDEFELHFLNFCKRRDEIQNIVQKPNVNSINFFGQEVVEYKTSLFDILEKIHVIENQTDSLNGDQLSNLLAKNQINENLNLSDQILDYDLIFKRGNPGSFDLKIFNSFSDDTSKNPVEKLDFSVYQNGSLPTINPGITLNQSQVSNSEAWNALLLYVGEYDHPKLKYTDNGSYITDFFIDFNIEFNSNNVINLSKIIKIYASQKVENESLTPDEFYETFNKFLDTQSDFQNNMLNHIFVNLNRKLPEVNINNQESRLSRIDGNVGKNEIYYTFKALNDKWISGRDFKERTLFEDVLILDTANRPAGNIIADVEKFRGLLNDSNATTSLYHLLDSLFTQNGFISFSIPTYYNFYGRNYRLKNSDPILGSLDAANDTFGTHLDVDFRDTRPKMLFIHRTNVSETVDMRNNTNYVFNDDSFDLRKSTLNPLVDSQNGVTDFSNRNKVVGFNVNFGNQNQSIFKNISIDMATQKTTSQAIRAQADLAEQYAGQEVAQQSQSLYNYYKALAFECTVECLGNAMIQPTMYFYLSNVPMFHGTYLIEEVNHSITPNNFVTTFTGVRAPIYRSQPPDKLVASVNRDLIKKYRDQVRSIDGSETPQNNSPVTSATTESTSGLTAANSSECQNITKYDGKVFVDAKQNVNEITESEVLNYVTSRTNDNNLINFIMTLSKVESDTYKNIFNNNLFGIRTDKVWGGTLSEIFNEQFCGRVNNVNIPYAVFEKYEDSIDFMVIAFTSYFILFEEYKRAEIANTNLQSATVLTDIWFSQWYYLNTGGEYPSQIIQNIDEILDNNPDLKSRYEQYRELFYSRYFSII